MTLRKLSALTRFLCATTSATSQMEGLVEGQEERHGVGRPRLVYVLTDEGMEHFPTRYMR
jgi:hypothetical protein